MHVAVLIIIMLTNTAHVLLHINILQFSKTSSGLYLPSDPVAMGGVSRAWVTMLHSGVL